MALPVIRPKVAQLALTRFSSETLVGLLERLQEENPEYLQAVRTMASKSRIGAADAVLVAAFCYQILLAQAEVEKLEALVGGDRAPACLR